jgi:CRISPR/Cas system-associated endonuclease/helicase Cas3
MKLLLLLSCILSISTLHAQAPGEKLVKDKITNLAHHLSKEGERRSVTFKEVKIGKPVNWTMEYGNNPAADKNTKVYKVIATFTVNRQTYNTASGKVYSTTATDYKRPYNFYIDRTGNWVCTPLGLSNGMY